MTTTRTTNHARRGGLIQPYITEGKHLLVLGTQESPHSTEIWVDVVVPVPQYSKEDVAESIWWGLEAINQPLVDLAGSSTPAIEGFTESFYGKSGRGALLAHAQGLDDVAEAAGYAYLEVSPRLEPGVQAMLVNSGLLPMLREASARRTSASTGHAESTRRQL